MRSEAGWRDKYGRLRNRRRRTRRGWGRGVHNPHSVCCVNDCATRHPQNGLPKSYLWDLVATSFATVWANVEKGLTWNTGNESLPSFIPRDDSMTEMKWIHEDLNKGSELVFVRSWNRGQKMARRCRSLPLASPLRRLWRCCQ